MKSEQEILKELQKNKKRLDTAVISKKVTSENYIVATKAIEKIEQLESRIKTLSWVLK